MSEWPIYVAAYQIQDLGTELALRDRFSSCLVFDSASEWADVWPPEALVELNRPDQPELGVGEIEEYVSRVGGLVATWVDDDPKPGRRTGSLSDDWYRGGRAPPTEGVITRIQVLSIQYAIDEDRRMYRPVPGTAQLRDVDERPRRFEDDSVPESELKKLRALPPFSTEYTVKTKDCFTSEIGVLLRVSVED